MYAHVGTIPDSRFKVRVHSKNGNEIIRMEPFNDRIIGTFEFHEGMDGFMEILAEDAKGQVLVDAVIFRKIGS